ncbi:Formiminotransferase-cyclodeaminase [Sporomusa ovata DSM 2662]|uniref:Formiminotetrahydrofolate cyclodeaminase n=1 Tax=Sporomusa ovata TaxID=2378 RepID=A0A0U1L5R0_9FIRM|nr:cyclodeaminase/cyclohydrolase family protein [Sporomusa ovata]EQB24681.1 formiminotransferase-cyclodeaminase [Sporomusa ovata DSM 2662]CQR75028.1 Formiminotetrahydrofolate cyclodeaminase [Sporomusa ovata]
MDEKMLVDLSIIDFANKVASYEPVVPAGGCVMALSGLMGVCLLEMSVDSAYGRPEGEEFADLLEIAKIQLTTLHSELLTYIEKDAEAYGRVLSAYKLPRVTLKETEHRQAEIQAAALFAIETPLKISAACISALEPGIMLLPKVKQGVLGDLKIGLLVIKTGIEGSLTAARINLPLIKDAQLVRVLQARINELQVKFDMAMTKVG